MTSNTEQEIAQIFKEQISCIFEETKKLPNYGQLSPTFIARPKKQDTYEKIRLALSGIGDGVVVESFKTSGNAHIIKFNNDSKIVIIYATSRGDFDWMYDYHSYSNSMIIGKMMKKIGLKYSEKGLQYIQCDLRENHQSVIGSIDITKDFSKVLSIVGLDYSKFRSGFKSAIEFFDFIIESPFLKVEKFINSEKEHRQTLLQKFEEYLILNKIKNENYQSLEFDRIESLFPEIDFPARTAELLAKAEKKKNIIDKLNGRVILDTIPGFDQKKIGMALGYFKHSFKSHEEYIKFMIEHSQEEVMSKFKEVNNIV